MAGMTTALLLRITCAAPTINHGEIDLCGWHSNRQTRRRREARCSKWTPILALPLRLRQRSSYCADRECESPRRFVRVHQAKRGRTAEAWWQGHPPLFDLVRDAQALPEQRPTSIGGLQRPRDSRCARVGGLQSLSGMGAGERLQRCVGARPRRQFARLLSHQLQVGNAFAADAELAQHSLYRVGGGAPVGAGDSGKNGTHASHDLGPGQGRVECSADYDHAALASAP